MEKKTRFDNPSVVSRIKYLLDTGAVSYSQAELARRIGMDPSNFSKHLTGKLAVSSALVNRLVVDLGVSKQWLVDGVGIPFPKPEHALTIQPEEISAPSLTKRGVPVYDVDVTAGCYPLERMLSEDRISGFIDLPRLNPECVVVKVNGDSMEPKIMDGGFVAIRPIKSLNNIFWGRIYVIVMEEYRMLKSLRRHPIDNSLVILHSENPDYDDMDVAREDIQALFLVESIINLKNLC